MKCLLQWKTKIKGITLNFRSIEFCQTNSICGHALHIYTWRISTASFFVLSCGFSSKIDNHTPIILFGCLILLSLLSHARTYEPILGHSGKRSQNKWSFVVETCTRARKLIPILTHRDRLITTKIPNTPNEHMFWLSHQMRIPSNGQRSFVRCLCVFLFKLRKKRAKLVLIFKLNHTFSRCFVFVFIAHEMRCKIDSDVVSFLSPFVFVLVCFFLLKFFAVCFAEKVK